MYYIHIYNSAVLLESCGACALMAISHLGSVSGCARGWRERAGRMDAARIFAHSGNTTPVD